MEGLVSAGRRHWSRRTPACCRTGFSPSSSKLSLKSIKSTYQPLPDLLLNIPWATCDTKLDLVFVPAPAHAPPPLADPVVSFRVSRPAVCKPLSVFNICVSLPAHVYLYKSIWQNSDLLIVLFLSSLWASFLGQSLFWKEKKCIF